VPTGPVAGDRLASTGGAVTVKLRPLLAIPPTVTTTAPVVAPVGTGTVILVVDQLVGVAATPLNVTVLVPCVAPKFVPAITTGVPIGPFDGVRLVRFGVVAAGTEIDTSAEFGPVRPAVSYAWTTKKYV